MNYYTYTGNKMYVAHFSGATKEIFPATIDKVKDITFNMPKNLSIITAVTDNVKSDSPIIYQLNKNKTSYINMVDRTEWSDIKKLEYIIQGLQNTSTDYCLIVDGLDVVITGDMDEALGIFKNMDYDVLFNASMYNTPKEDIEDIGDREQYGKFRYFNDGCCIGKTASLLKVYQDAYQYYKSGEFNSDMAQYYLRKSFDSLEKTD